MQKNRFFTGKFCTAQPLQESRCEKWWRDIWNGIDQYNETLCGIEGVQRMIIRPTAVSFSSVPGSPLESSTSTQSGNCKLDWTAQSHSFTEYFMLHKDAFLFDSSSHHNSQAQFQHKVQISLKTLPLPTSTNSWTGLNQPFYLSSRAIVLEVWSSLYL